jgi:myo-inositol catabolism protein IolS
VRSTGRIGSDGLELSVIGLGGFELGDEPGAGRVGPVLEAALDAGIDWVDTSEVYSDRANERVVGAAIASTGARGRTRIATKVAPEQSGTGFGAEQIRAACLGSIGRLGIDRIDLYFLHWPDDTGVPLEETWTAMRSLVDDGLVRAAGLSNFDREQIERCAAIGPVDAVQDGLSLIDYLEHRELFRWCRERGIAAVTFEPLANGMLTGAVTSPEQFRRVVGDDYAEWPFWQRLFAVGKFERSKTVADGMRAIAGDVGCTLAQLALAWNIHQEGVSATLAGSTNPNHVRDNAEASSIVLADEQLAELDHLVAQGPTFS